MLDALEKRKNLSLLPRIEPRIIGLLGVRYSVCQLINPGSYVEEERSEMREDNLHSFLIVLGVL